MGENQGYSLVRARVASPREQDGAEFGGAVALAVQKDEDGTAFAYINARRISSSLDPPWRKKRASWAAPRSRDVNLNAKIKFSNQATE